MRTRIGPTPKKACSLLQDKLTYLIIFLMRSPDYEKPKDNRYEPLTALTDEMFATMQVDIREYTMRPSDVTPSSREGAAIVALREDLTDTDLVTVLRKTRQLEDVKFSNPDTSIPHTALGKWIKQWRKNRNYTGLPTSSADTPSISDVEIIDPLRCYQQSLGMKTGQKAGCWAYHVSKMSFSGTLIINGHTVELYPDEPVIALDKMRYDPDDFHQHLFTNGQEHYALVPSKQKIYMPEFFPSPFSRHVEYKSPLNDPNEISSALESAKRILNDIQTEQDSRPW